MPHPAEPVMLTELTTNLKGPMRSTPLSRINVLFGPNFSGKTSLIQSLQLLGGDFAEDIAGRQTVRAGHLLQTLAQGRTTDIAIRGLLDNGDQLSWAMPADGTKAMTHRPDWWPTDPARIFPLEAATGAVQASEANFRTWMLGTLPPEELAISTIQLEYPEELRALFTKLAVQVGGSSPLETLGRVRAKVEGLLRKARADHKAAQGAVPKRSGLAPTPEAIAEAEQALQEADTALEAALGQQRQHRPQTDHTALRATVQTLKEELTVLERKIPQGQSALQAWEEEVERQRLDFAQAERSLHASRDALRGIEEAPPPKPSPVLAALEASASVLETQRTMAQTHPGADRSCLTCGAPIPQGAIGPRINLLHRQAQNLRAKAPAPSEGAQEARTQARNLVQAAEATMDTCRKALMDSAAARAATGKKLQELEGRAQTVRGRLREIAVTLTSTDDTHGADPQGPEIDTEALREDRDTARRALEELRVAERETQASQVLRERVRAAEVEAKRWEDFLAKTKEAEAALAERLEESFLMKCQPYVPEGWEFTLERGLPAWWMVMDDPNKPARHCLSTTPGAFRSIATSGAEYLAGLSALATMCATGLVNWVVLPDRGWWPDTLGELIKGLRSAPKHIQFFIPTTVKPKGVRDSKDVRIIDVTELR